MSLMNGKMRTTLNISVQQCPMVKKYSPTSYLLPDGNIIIIIFKIIIIINTRVSFVRRRTLPAVVINILYYDSFSL